MCSCVIACVHVWHHIAIEFLSKMYTLCIRCVCVCLYEEGKMSLTRLKAVRITPEFADQLKGISKATGIAMRSIIEDGLSVIWGSNDNDLPQRVDSVRNTARRLY